MMWSLSHVDVFGVTWAERGFRILDFGLRRRKSPTREGDVLGTWGNGKAETADPSSANGASVGMTDTEGGKARPTLLLRGWGTHFGERHFRFEVSVGMTTRMGRRGSLASQTPASVGMK
jgi:hypothetical protein